MAPVLENARNPLQVLGYTFTGVIHGIPPILAEQIQNLKRYRLNPGVDSQHPRNRWPLLLVMLGNLKTRTWKRCTFWIGWETF